MGIRSLVSNLLTLTIKNFNMKLQFALVLAVAVLASANQVDNMKAKFNAAKSQADSGMNQAVNEAQNFLNKNNVKFDVQKQVDNAVAQAIASVKAADYDKQAKNMGNQAKKNVNQALKKIENQKLRNNLLNLFKNVEAEARKALSN